MFGNLFMFLLPRTCHMHIHIQNKLQYSSPRILGLWVETKKLSTTPHSVEFFRMCVCECVWAVTFTLLSGLSHPLLLAPFHRYPTLFAQFAAA